MNKDRALFWIRRRIKELEAKSAPLDQETLAKAGASYAERQQLMKKRAEEAEGVAGELAAFREAADFIEEKA